MSFDIIIYNGIIVTVNPDFDIFENGLICIKDGKIVSIESRDNYLPLPDAEKVIDADGGIIMPGHGGLMDRLDSIIFAAPFIYLFLRILRYVS